MTDKGIVALGIDPANPRILHASIGGVDDDAGERLPEHRQSRTWHSISAGLPAVGVEVFAIDASGRTVFGGTGGDGVIRLRNQLTPTRRLGACKHSETLSRLSPTSLRSPAPPSGCSTTGTSITRSTA